MPSDPAPGASSSSLNTGEESQRLSVTDTPSMEGEAQESDEGGEKATVIWEKCIEQSIFVDLSEDESLHLSDFENSLALHLSQAESAASETSIHLNGES